MCYAQVMHRLYTLSLRLSLMAQAAKRLQVFMIITAAMSPRDDVIHIHRTLGTPSSKAHNTQSMITPEYEFSKPRPIAW